LRQTAGIRPGPATGAAPGAAQTQALAHDIQELYRAILLLERSTGGGGRAHGFGGGGHNPLNDLFLSHRALYHDMDEFVARLHAGTASVTDFFGIFGNINSYMRTRLTHGFLDLGLQTTNLSGARILINRKNECRLITMWQRQY
jgi:hypothetical protein